MSRVPSPESPFARIRSAARAVADSAQQVRIDDEGLRALAVQLEGAVDSAPLPDPAHGAFERPTETLAFIVTLDAINFGSGWFPALEKRPGCSGYFTIANSLRERFDGHGAWSAAELTQLEGAACARIFGQEQRASEPAVAELMELFARALRELGHFLLDRFEGDFEALVGGAGHRADALVGLLAEMPLYRDVSLYQGIEVPFYKRAQITAMDLAMAFEGRGPGRFDDLDELTLFADNLVPHVLHCEGVLNYDASLEARIDKGELLLPGSMEEVEIRAVAVHAVERLSELIRKRTPDATASRLDHLLWNRGQRPEFKARPRHRCRCPFY